MTVLEYSQIEKEWFDSEESSHSHAVVKGPDGVPYRAGCFPHYKHADAAPSWTTFKEHGPFVVTGNPMARNQKLNGSSDQKSVVTHDGKQFRISSDMFEGKVIFHARGFPCTDQDAFAGKKRLAHVIFQGRFKHPMDACHWTVGQEFVKPLPAANRRIVELILSMVSRVFSNSTQISVGTMPYFVSPVLTTCNVLNASLPGQEPDMWDTPEDVTLFDARAVDSNGQPLSSDKRKKFYDKKSNMVGLHVTPDLVWTLHAWQHVLDLPTYKLCMGPMMTIDLTAILKGQPIQIMSKNTQTGELLFSLCMWHERLLYDSDADQEKSDTKPADSFVSIASRMGSGFLGMLSRPKA